MTETNTGNKTIFGGGIPTEPDVRKLMDAFGVPIEGALFSHESISRIIECHPKSHRYRSVTTAWRKKLEHEHNVVLIAERGYGLKAATPDDRVEHGHGKLRSGQRITRRAYRVIGTTDLSRATPANRKQAERDLSVAKAIMTAARIESRKFRPELPAPDSEETE
jgi:hypothetical protein